MNMEECIGIGSTRRTSKRQFRFEKATSGTCLGFLAGEVFFNFFHMHYI